MIRISPSKSIVQSAVPPALLLLLSLGLSCSKTVVEAADGSATDVSTDSEGDTGSNNGTEPTEPNDTGTSPAPDTASDTGEETDSTLSDTESSTASDTDSEPEDSETLAPQETDSQAVDSEDSDMDAGTETDADRCSLINGGAEDGTLNGWTGSGPEIAAVTEQVETKGTVTPFAGERFFTFADAQSDASTLSQSQAACLVPGSVVRLSGYVQTEFFEEMDGDFGTVRINIQDADGTVVATGATENLSTQVGEWHPFLIELTVPDNAAGFEVVLAGTLQHGTYVNVFYDEVSLAAECACSEEDTEIVVL